MTRDAFRHSSPINHGRLDSPPRWARLGPGGIWGPAQAGNRSVGLKAKALTVAVLATLIASAPSRLFGLIEARGVGILQAHALPKATIQLAVDMATPETERVPPDRRKKVLECSLPLLHKVESPHFAAAIRQYLKGDRAIR